MTRSKSSISKKSQITLFIALGIIIIGIFGVMAYLVSDYTQTQQERQIIDSNRQVNQDLPLRGAIASCLEDAAYRGLKMAGKQGGVLYQSQGGSQVDRNQLRLVFGGENNSVHYAIINPSDTPPPPMYPYKDVSYSYTLLKQLFPDSNFFGRVELPKLCSRLGPNRPENPNGYITCPVDSYGFGDTPIQEIIRKYIEQDSLSCLRSVFDRDDLPVDEFIFDFIIGEQDVIISLESSENSTFFDSIDGGVSTIIPVRLKRVYQLMSRVLEKDASDVYFDKGVDYKQLRNCRFGQGTDYCWDEFMQLYVLREVYGFDDVVRIEDRSSLIDGSPFVFQAAVANRPPMLDFIFDEATGINRSVNVHRFVEPGGVLSFDPIGLDPDEDNLTFRYANTYGFELQNSDMYTSGIGCQGVLRTCASVIIGPYDLGYQFTTQVHVEDGSGLFDYQDVGVQVANVIRSQTAPALPPPPPSLPIIPN